MAVIEEVILRLRVISEDLKGFNQAMGMSMENFKKMNKANVTIANTGARLANRFRMLTHGMRGFRMEMLSVMFFGMGINRFFSGLLQPAMEAAGIFELISTTLQILFLPVALMLLDVLMPILDWFLNLPEGVQVAIGAFVVIAAVLGQILFLAGSITLGFGGLATAFGTLGAGLAALGIVFGVILIVFAVVAAAVALFVLMWKTNFAGIREWMEVFIEGVKNVFGGLMNFLKGIIKIITGIFTGDWQKVKEGFKQAIEGIFQFFVLGLGRMMLAVIGWVVSVVVEIAKFGVKFIAGLAKIFVDAAKEAFEFGKTLIEKIIEGIKSVGHKITETISGFLPEPVKNVLGKVGGFIKKITPFAEGGIVTSPTLSMIGERGPEAVIPLDKAGSFGGTLIFSPTINVSATSNVDIDRLITRITTDVRSELERTIRR